MFSHKPVLFIYLKKELLQLYDNQGLVDKLAIPDTSVKYLEIVEEKAYRQLVEDFFTQLNLKQQRVLIALSKETYFEKKLTATPEELKLIADKFFEMVPVKNSALVKKTVLINDEFVLVAVNKELYLPLIDILDGLDCEAVAVVPASLYPDFQDQETLDQGIVGGMLSDQIFLKQSNLLNESTDNFDLPSASGNNNHVSLSSVKRFSDLKVMILLLFLAVVGFVVLLYFQGYLAKLLPQQFSQGSPKQTDSQEIRQLSDKLMALEASKSAKEASLSAKLNKEEVKIQVLNGSKVAGQAAKIKAQLLEIGFQKIEVGNITLPDLIGAILAYSSQVPEDLRKEIVTVIKENFPEVKQTEATSSAFDIVITTGR